MYTSFKYSKGSRLSRNSQNDVFLYLVKFFRCKLVTSPPLILARIAGLGRVNDNLQVGIITVSTHPGLTRPRLLGFINFNSIFVLSFSFKIHPLAKRINEKM